MWHGACPRSTPRGSTARTRPSSTPDVGFCPYRVVVTEPQVEVRRSRRRRRTVTAYREGDTVIGLLPAQMTRAEEEHGVAEMLARLQRSETRRRSPARTSDEALLTRCAE